MAKCCFMAIVSQWKKNEAAQYFKSTADLGEINSMYMYSKMLSSGDGILVEKTEAAKYFKFGAQRS